MVNFDDWCYHAVAQIRFKPDRQMVFDELKAHLEDSYDHFLAQGYPAEMAQNLAMEAMGDPEEIASVAAFLCTEDSSWVSGQNIFVSGGAICH